VVAEVAPDQIERLPLLNDVLDLGLPETELTAALEPKLRQQSLVALLLSLLRAWARERPLILVLEDAHWLDSLSWELAVQGARALTASGEPLLLVLVTRPLDERSPGAQYAAALRAMANAETLPLITLSPEETVALVTGRLGLPEGNLPDPVAALVRERAGGNPFFAEELVLTLRDQGVIAIEPAPKTPGPSASAAAKPGLLNRCVISGDLAQANRTLPHSIQGLVLARVDRLPSGQQLTLKVASVIGRVFPFRTLHAVHPVEADRLRLPDHLEALVRLDVTLLETPEPELAYAFKHIITQEVAYESLLYAHRRELHHRVGEHLERTYPDSLEEYYELLAHHYVQSGDRDKSWDYLLKAGDKARDKYANEAAIAYYNEALSTDGDTSDVHRVHESLAGVLALAGRYGEALDHYASARALVEAQTPSDDHAHHLADLCCQTAAVCEKRSEYKRAFEWLERGLGYLDETKPTIEAARIYLMGGGLFYRQGEYDEAVDWCQKSLTLASQIATREGQQVMGRACYLLGLVSIRCGDLHYAVQLCRESIHIYQQIDDLVGQANAYNNLASAYFNQGDWARASDANHKSLAIRQEIGDVHGQAMIANNLAEIYLYRGQWTQATSLYGQNRAIAGQIGATLLEAVTLSNLAHVHIYQENWTEAETCLGRSQAIFAEIGSVEGFLAELERRWGEFYLRTGKLDQALDHARRSIGLAVEQDNPLEEGMSRRVLGQIHLARGEWGPAEAALRQSLRALKRLNSEYEAAKTELSLARLAMETGSISMHEAQDHLAQAIETFERLGAQADLAEAQSLAIARKRLRDDRTATTTSALMG
jgi:tetratricopeptide (TPR) repeat protein